MKWNKVLALLLVAVMSMAMLASCSSSDDSSTAADDSSATDSSTTADSTEVETTEEWASDIQTIIDRGVLRVGVKNDVLGFGFQDILTGEYEGMEIDLAQMIADYLGVDIEYTAVTAATRTELLDSGDLDCVVATFTVTDERKESWSFTTAYYVDAVTALVEDTSGITCLEDLVGCTVGVSSGSTSARAMVAQMVELGLIDADAFDYDTFDAATWTEGVSFRQYDNYPAISTALAAGEVDAFSVDKSILSYYNTAGRSYIDDNYSPQDYGVATTLGSGLSELCEELVSAWIADGTIDALCAEHGI